jgi:hypothetical protein
MLVLASFNGPSEIRFWTAFIGSILLAALLGYWVRTPANGFKLGGLAGAGLSFVVLGSAQGDIVTLVTMFYTPVFALIAGFVGCYFGWIGDAVRISRKASQRIENQDSIASSSNPGSDENQDRQPDDAPQFPGFDNERDSD